MSDLCVTILRHCKLFLAKNMFAFVKNLEEKPQYYVLHKDSLKNVAGTWYLKNSPLEIIAEDKNYGALTELQCKYILKEADELFSGRLGENDLNLEIKSLLKRFEVSKDTYKLRRSLNDLKSRLAESFANKFPSQPSPAVLMDSRLANTSLTTNQDIGLSHTMETTSIESIFLDSGSVTQEQDNSRTTKNLPDDSPLQVTHQEVVDLAEMGYYVPPKRREHQEKKLELLSKQAHHITESCVLLERLPARQVVPILDVDHAMEDEGDPFADFDDSSDAYEPSESRSTSDESLDYPNVKSTKKNVSKIYEAEEIHSKRKQLELHKLESDNGASHDAYFSLNEKRVTLKIIKTMHKGIYKNNFDKGFPIQLAPFASDSQCATACDVGIACTFSINNKDTVILKLPTCLRKGTYEGLEVDMHSFTFGTLKLLDVPEIFANTNSRKGKRVLKSKCIFCLKVLASRNLTDHYKRLHSKEQRVADALKFEKHSLERLRAFRVLKNEGNRSVDSCVPRDLRIPNRRPATLSSVDESVICPNCDGLFSAHNFSRHDQKCTGRSSTYERVTATARKREFDKEVASDNSVFSASLKNLFESLRKDHLYYLIIHDSALMAMARFYALGSSFSNTKAKNVRQQLRLLARLLLVVKDIDPSIVNYGDLFNLEKYNILLSAVVQYIGMDPKLGTINKHSTAMFLKSCVTNLAVALRYKYGANSSDDRNAQKMKAINNFLETHNKLYTECINKPSYALRAEKRMLKSEADKMILDKDLQIFMNHVQDKADELLIALTKETFEPKVWKELGKATLTLIVTFNRRRVGEASRLQLQSYQQRTKLSKDILDGADMSPLEKALAKNFSIMRLVGKNVRENTVLLSERHISYLEEFLRHRKRAGVTDDNKYLFGVPTTQKYLDAAAAIRKFAHECGAERPDTLRGGLFRRHAATMSQMLQLSDNDIQQLSDFLGHSVDTHKRHYRTVCNLQEVCVLSKFFLSAACGQISKYRGKTISEIEVMLDAEYPGAGAINEDEEPINFISPNVIENDVCNVTPKKKSRSRVFYSPQQLRTKHTSPQKQRTFDMSPRIKKGFKRSKFSDQQLKKLNETFGSFIKRKIYPQNPILTYKQFLKDNSGLFPGLKPSNIHSFIQYRIKK